MKNPLRPLLAGLCLVALVVVSCQAESSQLGKPFPLEALTYVDAAPDVKGKPAIMEFWATYCAPCVKLIPHLNELYAKYKGQGLVVVGVSQDLLKTDIAKFRQKTPIDYPVAFDDEGKLGAQMGVEAIPYAFVVDRTGKVVWEGLSAKLTEEVIEKALK